MQRREHADVVAWTFVSQDLQFLLKYLTDDRLTTIMESYSGQIKLGDTQIYSVQETFLEATDLTYLIPSEIQTGFENLRKLPTGEPNVVELLYAERGNYPVPGSTKDAQHILSPDQRLKKTRTAPVKVLMQEGLRDIFSVSTDSEARLCLGTLTETKTSGKVSTCEIDYRLNPRAMLKKMPGFYFTGARNAVVFNKGLISELQYMEILEDVFELVPGSRQKFDDMVEKFGMKWTNNIPKYKLYVKLSPSISAERREFVANGIRSFFQDDVTVLLDTEKAMKSVVRSAQLFDIFVAAVGVIALVLAFFMLMVSTTQNIKDNLWEYGCLRAIGLNKGQTLRLSMYEQLSVILSALVLGYGVGLILMFMVSQQFFMLLEFSYGFTVPTALLFMMTALSLGSTFYAVSNSVRAVNDRPIASVVKGLS